MSESRYSRDEVARLGELIYDRDIAPQVASAEPSNVVAVDVASGDFEVAADELTAIDGVRARHPDAQVWLRRVGSPYLHRFGARPQPSGSRRT